MGGCLRVADMGRRRWGGSAQDVMYGKKERKRLSLRRDYIGDYIGYLDNAQLRALMGACAPNQTGRAPEPL